MITSPSVFAATVEPIVAVARPMTVESRIPDKMMEATAAARRRATADDWSCLRLARRPSPTSAGGESGQGILEDRQQAVKEQGDQRRLPAEADGRDRQREDGNR